MFKILLIFLTFWSLPTFAQRTTVLSADFAPDGRTLAIAIREHPDAKSWHLEIWNVKPFKRIKRLETRQRNATVLFSPNGKLLASATHLDFGRVFVWDIKKEKIVWKSPEYRHFYSIHFSADSTRFLVSTKDGHFIHNFETHENLEVPSNPAEHFVLTSDPGHILGLPMHLPFFTKVDLKTGKVRVDCADFQYARQILPIPDTPEHALVLHMKNKRLELWNLADCSVIRTWDDIEPADSFARSAVSKNGRFAAIITQKFNSISHEFSIVDLQKNKVLSKTTSNGNPVISNTGKLTFEGIQRDVSKAALSPTFLPVEHELTIPEHFLNAIE